ncbi:MAG: phytanoyl-CoA dioxygenase family protein [Planctomycetaceae bacterium]|nr:phytanoyl-CoA dioxygenase family protein [Planctomycetaceae bacterium]|tara:strand:+ start:197 stop:1033 length:837 start_codon:yes stop_codon:yes gene_type:complete
MSNEKQEFDIIPQYDSIEEIERDLDFFPAKEEGAKALTVEQLRHYNEKGYISNLDVFSKGEANELREYFDELLDEVIKSGGDSYSISTAHLKHVRVYDLLKHPAIVNYVKDILGDNVVGWGSHFFCKMPHDGKAVSWHQDASYWPLTPSKTATVWLAIDDTDHENACMRFIPKSHLHGHLEWHESNAEENNVLNQTVSNALNFGESPVDNELKAGQMSIHNDLLLHGSNANDSGRRRCGLTLRYCAADVHAYLDWNLKGVIVSGEADSRLWPGAKRPD